MNGSGQVEVQAASRRLCPRGTLFSVLALLLATACRGAAQLPAGLAQAWAEAAAQKEVHVIDDDGSFPLRYRSHKIDAKGDTLRDVIETKQGAVARLVAKDGRALTREEDAAERERLTEVAASPEDFARHHRRDNSTRQYAINLVRLMPSAMIWSYAPGQPQPANAQSPQVVLDFKPDPKFNPPTMVANVLTGLEGRLWVDRGTQQLTRAEGRVVQPVNFGLGVVAKIFPGGTIEFEQAQVGSGRWIYSHLVEHLKIRELMVRTASDDAEVTASDFQLLPAPLTLQEAVATLLAAPVPVR